MSQTKKMMQMAPNSNFDFMMTSKGEEIKAGKYLAKYTAFWSQDANGQYADAKGTRFDYTKTWEQEVTVTAQQQDATDNPYPDGDTVLSLDCRIRCVELLSLVRSNRYFLFPGLRIIETSSLSICILANMQMLRELVSIIRRPGNKK